jgi:hypothetical protein
MCMEYENVTQNVLLFIESILQNAKQLQHAASFFFRFENYRPHKSDNNLQSHCKKLYLEEECLEVSDQWKRAKLQRSQNQS